MGGTTALEMTGFFLEAVRVGCQACFAMLLELFYAVIKIEKQSV
jgi:hypothetical protein